MTKMPEADEPVGAERRQSKRLPFAFQIEISGRDSTGTEFHDRTLTTDISERGCRFDLLRQLNPGGFVKIRLVDQQASGSPQWEDQPLFEVVCVTPSEHGWSIGARQLQSKAPWPVTFPHPKKPA